MKTKKWRGPVNSIFSWLLAATLGITVALADEPQPLELPDCDIFVFDVNVDGETLALSNPTNITNRPGYDNQPWFTPSSKSVLFTANRKADRTDVFEYFFDTKETKQVTDSATQEYSPQVGPDNKTLSFVADGTDIRQSIWAMDRGGKPEWLLSASGDREPVGYYAWNHESGDILFWSRYGFGIRLAHEDKAESKFVCGNAVPSTPHVIPGTKKFSFVHRQANEAVWIKEFDPEDLSTRPLAAVPGSNSNYGWTPDGRILMFDGTVLKMTTPEPDSEWTDVADVADFGIESATRVAVSPDGKRLAVVGLGKE